MNQMSDMLQLVVKIAHLDDKLKHVGQRLNLPE